MLLSSGTTFTAYQHISNWCDWQMPVRYLSSRVAWRPHQTPYITEDCRGWLFHHTSFSMPVRSTTHSSCSCATAVQQTLIINRFTCFLVTLSRTSFQRQNMGREGRRAEEGVLTMLLCCSRKTINLASLQGRDGHAMFSLD